MKRARMENILDSDYSNWISDKHTGILDEDIDQRNACYIYFSYCPKCFLVLLLTRAEL